MALTDTGAAGADKNSAATPAAAEPAPDLTGLIKVLKDGATLHVHPTCLDEHVKLGWKAVQA